VIAAARHLSEAGRVDPKRIAIHGGSAGGFTTLAALSQSDVFTAGGDFYGVADLEALARDTHKFESRYLDGLIGPWPDAKATYDARSPINHLAGFSAPLLILQGADDPIVPPNQAYMIRDALLQKGAPVAMIEFPAKATASAAPRISSAPRRPNSTSTAASSASPPPMRSNRWRSRISELLRLPKFRHGRASVQATQEHRRRGGRARARPHGISPTAG